MSTIGWPAGVAPVHDVQAQAVHRDEAVHRRRAAPALGSRPGPLPARRSAGSTERDCLARRQCISSSRPHECGQSSQLREAEPDARIRILEALMRVLLVDPVGRRERRDASSSLPVRRPCRSARRAGSRERGARRRGARAGGRHRHPRPQPARRQAAVDRRRGRGDPGAHARHARAGAQEPLRVHGRHRVPGAQAGARHRGVRRHRSESHGRRDQSRRRGAHGEGHRGLRPGGVDADLRRREPGAHVEGGSPVCQRVARRRAAARGQAGDRRSSPGTTSSWRRDTRRRPRGCSCCRRPGGKACAGWWSPMR